MKLPVICEAQYCEARMAPNIEATTERAARSPNTITQRVRSQRQKSKTARHALRGGWDGNNHLTDGVSSNLESCWSRSVVTAIRLSTQRVWHTFNYDVTISNGVNLCHLAWGIPIVITYLYSSPYCIPSIPLAAC